MRRIFKYPLEITDYQTVKVKGPAILLSAMEQNEDIVMYALVDDMENEIPIDVRIIGTGHPIKDNIESYKFLGTVKLNGGLLMFHVFGRHSKDFIRIIDKGDKIPLLVIDKPSDHGEGVGIEEFEKKDIIYS